MNRYYIIFKGRVQGVGFRYTLKETADKYHLTGSCMNLYNGDVSCFVQGEEPAFRAFMKEITMPRRYILIEDYAIKKVAVEEDEKSFSVRYY